MLRGARNIRAISQCVLPIFKRIPLITLFKSLKKNKNSGLSLVKAV